MCFPYARGIHLQHPDAFVGKEIILAVAKLSVSAPSGVGGDGGDIACDAGVRHRWQHKRVAGERRADVAPVRREHHTLGGLRRLEVKLLGCLFLPQQIRGCLAVVYAVVVDDTCLLEEQRKECRPCVVVWLVDAIVTGK